MKFFFKEIGKAFFIGVLVFLVLGIILYLTNNYTIDSGKELLYNFIYNQMYAVSLYMANMYIIKFFLDKYDVALFKLKNIAKAFLASIGVTLLTLFVISFILIVLVKGFTVEVFVNQLEFKNYKISILISLVITVIFYVFYYYKSTQDKRVKEQKIIAGTASAQFDALKNQLDPHFLFNSLNVLTSLIEENPKAATKFTTSLSKVYRYVLEQKNKELVTVEEELKFASLYMSLLKMRFEDSIVFVTPETLSNPEAKVVPLSLQLLLENAVKHNQVTPSRKLRITIFEDDGNLVIENNVQSKQVVKESTGVGLRNIKQRYYLLTDRAVKVFESKDIFKVAIPMLTQATSSNINTQEQYISDKRMERAKEHVNKLKGFYGNLGMYVLFIPIFIWLNIKSNAGFPWAIFPIAGWGFGVLAHAAETFSWNPFFGKDWEDRKIRQFMDEDN